MLESSELGMVPSALTYSTMSYPFNSGLQSEQNNLQTKALTGSPLYSDLSSDTDSVYLDTTSYDSLSIYNQSSSPEMNCVEDYSWIEIFESEPSTSAYSLL